MSVEYVQSPFTKYMSAFNECRSFSAFMHRTGWQHEVSGEDLARFRWRSWVTMAEVQEDPGTVGLASVSQQGSWPRRTVLMFQLIKTIPQDDNHVS